MDQKSFYSITTRRFTIRCNHVEWLRNTQELYNQVLLFYYQLILDLEERAPGSLSSLSAQKRLRELEVLTIVGKDKKPVPYPIPWEKVPLYFRRAAINGAGAAAKGYLGRLKGEWSEQRTESFQNGVTYYKGMYRELTEKSVSLKSWTGAEWKWMHCRLSGNYIPGKAEALSPMVVSEQGGYALLVPVKEAVADGRKAKERIKSGTRLCCVQFANEDAFAVGVVIDAEGRQKAVRFFKGGREYAHRCREILDKIDRSERALGVAQPEPYGDHMDGEKHNNRYWIKLKNLNHHYSHCVSRQMIEFAGEQNAGIIVLPKYGEKFTKYVMLRAGNWSPLHLSTKIREQLGYKAWKAGIVVLEVIPNDTSSHCAICGAAVKKSGSSYECINGHRGSRHLNTARNLGKKCLRSFGKEIP